MSFPFQASCLVFLVTCIIVLEASFSRKELSLLLEDSSLATSKGPQFARGATQPLWTRTEIEFWKSLPSLVVLIKSKSLAGLGPTLVCHYWLPHCEVKTHYLWGPWSLVMWGEGTESFLKLILGIKSCDSKKDLVIVFYFSQRNLNTGV